MVERFLARAIVSLRTASVVALGAIGGLTLAAVPALAQQQTPPQANGAPATQTPPDTKDAAKAPLPQVPRNVLAGLLADGAQNGALLRSFLAKDGASPDAISQRAVDLVEALKQSGLVANESVLALAAQRVARAASDTLNAAPILELKVDKTFHAPPGIKAFDFGPPDKAPVAGFQRVLPNDPMLAGQVHGLRRPGDESGLLSGGVAGVKSVKVALPDGEYRVTLLTEAIGDATLGLAPFGETIDANGQKVRVLEAPPDQWSRMTVLSNQGLAGAADGSPGAGGAITLIVHVVGGQLDLGFQFANTSLQTYLTGMVVEPFNQPSIFARTPDAPPLQPDTANRLRREASMMAELVAAAKPSAGQPLVPAQDNRLSASPS